MKRLCMLLSVLACVAVIVSSAVCAPILLQSGTIEVTAKTPGQLAAGPSGPAYYILQFEGPVLDGWKTELTSLGIDTLDYVPEYAFVVRMDNRQRSEALELDFVRGIQHLLPIHRTARSLRESRPAALNTDVDVHIELFSGEPPAEVRKLIQQVGGVVLSEHHPASRFIRATVPASAIQKIAGLESVMWIEEWVQPRSLNNVAQEITGVAAVRQEVPLYGEGQILAFADSGLDTGNLDTMSPDFAARILRSYAMKRPSDWSDPTGHGTFVIGNAAGSGVLSGSNPTEHSYENSLAGVAPESQIIIQSIGDESGYVYPPLDLEALFQPVYEDGARVHNNSWGIPVFGMYSLYSRQVDKYVWENRDFVLVFPAGNEAVDANSDGVTDLNSMYTPATAKNCITVGATESVRNTGWNTSYGQAWPSDFPSEPLRSDHVSDNAVGMAAWSGRGPCSDGRIKPDICAPGTNIVSNRRAGGGTGWATYDSNYMYWGGTSFSTPMVAGAAALVREFFIKKTGIGPSAALVKALLLNSATDLSPGQYPPPAPMEIPQRPNSVQGWGRLDVLSAVSPEPPCFVEFVDNSVGLSTGSSATYSYEVLGDAAPFSVTLVWTDPPASTLSSKQLINNLDLTVRTPSGAVLRGNGAIDSTNNVESVDIPTPAPGVYMVTVSAINVPEGPQPFALAASGILPGTYVEGSVVTSTGKPISGASITVSNTETSKITTSGSNGRYATSLSAGTYTITPSKQGWTFYPTSREVTIVDGGVTGMDFTGTAPSGSMSGSINKTVGGLTNYVIETPHPYQNRSNLAFPVVGHPSASWIQIHFDEISVEAGYDFVVVEDGLGNEVDTYTGVHYDVWSSVIAGNTLTVRLISDEIQPDYGFITDGYRTDIVDLGGLEGVPVRAEPGGYTTVTGPGGTFELADLEPVSYTVTADLPDWQMRPDSLSVNVPPGAVAHNVDFQAFPPATVEGRVVTGDITSYSTLVESDHPYANNEYAVYTVQGPAGASRIRVHFSLIDMETGFDFVFVLDANDMVVDTWTGMHEDVWSSWVEGDTLKIALESDENVSYYGFHANRYEVSVNERGVQGVTISFEPGGRTAVTGADGTYMIEGLKVRQYNVHPDKPYHGITPDYRLINTAAGVVTTGVDFQCTILAMPGIGYLKSLPDGDEVLLNAKTVTSGSDIRPGHLYVEENDRSSGIKVVTDETIPEGAVIDIAGTMATEGERLIQASRILSAGTGDLPAPLGVVSRNLGGGCTSGDGVGLSNIGLLVRTWGKVVSGGQYGGENCFEMSDGSDNSPIMVLCRNATPPAEGTPVAVVGISTCRPDGQGGFRRTLEVRHDSDIEILDPSM